MILRTTIDTPLGPLMVFAGDAGVVRTIFVEDGPADGVLLDAAEDRRKAAPIRREVEAYFGGVLRTFETPADLSEAGDGFGRRVLETVRKIPYGQMWTYGDVAAAAGAPRGGRAAGSALARCPIELFVPCHRVVRAGPSLGSYGRHDDRRRFLLRLEGALTDASSVP
jgi:methylated-DNA-[protein]-cysteine S-methyltransferase